MGMTYTTRARRGATERRCPRPEHRGKRWLPLNAQHFYADGRGGFNHWCKACQREYALARYYDAHPGSKPRESRAYRTLDAATASWGRA